MVVAGVSPTLSSPGGRPANTSRCISCMNSWMRGPLTTSGVVSPYLVMSTTPAPIGSRSSRPSGSSPSTSTLESRQMTSIRNPSTPRSSQRFIIA